MNSAPEPMKFMDKYGEVSISCAKLGTTQVVTIKQGMYAISFDANGNGPRRLIDWLSTFCTEEQKVQSNVDSKAASILRDRKERAPSTTSGRK